MPRAVLGEVPFDAVYEEAPDHSNEITDKPVESGANVADHVRPLAITLSISGVVAGDDSAHRLEILRRYRDQGALLTYVGRNVLREMVIESFKTTHGVDVRNGFTFEMTLRQIRIVALQTANFLVPPEIAPQTNQTANGGTKQSDQDEANDRRSFAKQIWDVASSYLNQVLKP